MRVAAAKAGPDYIDPTFHARRAAAPCFNLDPWAMRPATLAGTGRRARSRRRHRAVRRGDGALRRRRTATARPARPPRSRALTGWPVVLVVDAAGQGASVAALVAGFARHDRGGADRRRHLQPGRQRAARRAAARGAIARHLPELPVLGAMPRDTALALAVAPSRAWCRPASSRTSSKRSSRGAASADRGRSRYRRGWSRWRAVACVAGATGAPGAAAARPAHRRRARRRLRLRLPGGAGGLAPAAARNSSFFSPLADEAPDPAADAIYLPGGYPELHAGRLAAAARFLAGLREAAARGSAIYGECGGYMVLGDDADRCRRARAPHGRAAAARDQLRGAAAASRLPRRDACSASGPLGAAGARFRGHEFHYASIVDGRRRASRSSRSPTPRRAISARAGLRRGSVAGSFIHLIDREED